MSQILEKAREYELQQEKTVPPGTRPGYHFSPRVGWLNDPNGFSWYKGQFHLFYQYHPYGPQWGPMHWGHAVSKDLIRWQYKPAALAPDTPYDEGGCFSGTAETLPDGRQLLMYTSVVWLPDDPDHRGFQTQSLAVGDGENYSKYEGNPVLTAEDLPKGGNPYEFRDPKIWQEEDGTWRAIAANQNETEGAQMLLFRSRDGWSWEFAKTLVRNDHRLGTMWECPDFFRLDEKQVLIGSAMNMLEDDREFHSGNNSFYMTGEYDRESESYREEVVRPMDYGIDFYAPQTLEAPDGRRILIGWMQNPDTANQRTVSHPVFGQMTIPRELSIRDGKLYQQPVREIAEYHDDMAEYQGVTIEEETSLPGVSGRQVDLDCTVYMEPRKGNRFTMRFAKDADFYTELSYFPEEGIVRLDRKFSGQRRAIIRHRDAKVSTDGVLKIRLLLDRYSVEAFVNEGEKVMTMTLETRLSAEEITFAAEGGATMDIRKYRLRSGDEQK